jgi:hypothetical protein
MENNFGYPDEHILPGEAIATKESTAADLSKEVVMHHLNSFLDNNVEALLSDYTDDSVVITEAATYSTVEEIRGFFTCLNMHFPPKNSTLVLEKLVAHNNLVYIVWHAKTPSLEVAKGSDTFVLRNGKIYQQTFVGQLNFVVV